MKKLKEKLLALKEKIKNLFSKKKSRNAFIDVLRDFKEFEDNYFIVYKESEENGLEITIASKEQKLKASKKEEKE